MGQALEICVSCENKRGCDNCADLHNWIMEHLEPRQKWFSVKDRLPEHSALYLVWKGGTWGVAVFYVTAKLWITEDMDGSNITHWMPLPEPPNGGSKR